MLIEKAEYRPRLIDPVVEKHLKAFGAIEITGTMWSGKTTTSKAHGSSLVKLDESQTREVAEMSSESVLGGAQPRVLDEWQEVPLIWDAVRRKVDEAGNRKGLYILTGSSRPSKGSTHHTGSGRISRLRMWPMSLSESKHSNASVSLSTLFEGKFHTSSTEASLESLAKLICRGGWPAALELDDDLAELIPTQYLDTLVSSEDKKAPENEYEQMKFLRSLARNVGSAVKIDTLVEDMGYLDEGKPTETGRRRIRNLLGYFTNRFVVDALPGWEAPIKSPQRLRTKSKYDFADPSLAAALLGLDPHSLLENMQVFGQLFEQLCLRDLHAYTSTLQKAAPDSLRYYRDADGLEVDVIIELRDKRWAAIEIKLGATKVKAAEHNLLRLKNKVASNPAAQNPDPAFLMVLVGAGNYAYKTPGGIYVVPITCLGA
jgi:predicted AAA+ superfamily ATPase